ncbi:DNA/RNA non-specific endonuclease [Chitinophaga polysaccharea]|uniref:DNA/RNA non-specific endonuclease n=1 Tax=Chitinophaga polysaccharea TaxID=1293035 RepID=UPI0014557CF0|nr:DNA/RNA non-specific endonuclease [Chitinophaga polysaccharea]NLR62573.1 DNA/RNA non-specific endonuclease [Chitinophaga polysaccharea]
MKTLIRQCLVICLGAFLFTACKKEADIRPQDIQKPSNVTTESVTLFSEDVESGTKTAYAVGSVSLTSGSWTLDDALIGTLSADLKNGSKSIRIRNTGSVTTNFSTNTSGTVTVTVKHGTYGTDANSTWQLWVSADNGQTWTQQGNTITTSGSLQTATFSFSATGSLRISIRKTSGSSNRINIDDITLISGSSTGGGTGGGTIPGDDNNMLLGNPSNALADISSENNYLMAKTYYTLSYSRSRGTPNWVSWHIQASDLGSVSRSNDFRADTDLPAGWYQVQNSSYSGSGFDRGHNCPSGDRTATTEANSATFLMTNMMPQAPNNNQKTWANLENYTRGLVNAGNEVYVIDGSYGQGGTGSLGGVTNTIDNGHVTVPSNIWKVIVVLPAGNNDLGRINGATRVIAVNTPNNNGINTDWTQYKTTVRDIENATGYNLLSNLRTTLQDSLETKIDVQ